MLIVIFVGLLLVLFLIGFSIPYALSLTSIVGMGVFNNGAIAINTVTQKIVSGTSNFTLLAIPFFLLAGKLMNLGSITQRIFRFCNALVGWIPGGLGHANILASIVFAGMSGSAVADAAGLGTIEIAAMKDEGYDVDFAAAITAASSTIGPIIPPSIPLVMFGVAGSVSIAKLLVAGIIPGLLMGLALGVMVYYYAKRRKYPRLPFPGLRELWHLSKSSFWALMTPVILIGGILSGIFTATEAAAVASLYAFILTVIVYREVRVKDLIGVLREVVAETAAIMLIVGASTLFGYLLIRMRVPTIMLNVFLSISRDKYVFLLMINIFLLIVGCFMETNSAILILTPILLPVAVELGVHPIQFGIIMVLNLMMGLLTPPVGMCLYATAGVAKISFERMVRATAPFYIPLIVVLLMVTYIPGIVLFIPNLL